MKKGDVTKIVLLVLVGLAAYKLLKSKPISLASALSGLAGLQGSSCPKPKPCFTLKTLKSDCPVPKKQSCPVCAVCPPTPICPICPVCPSVSAPLSQGIQNAASGISGSTTVSPVTASADFGSVGRSLEFS